MSFSITSSPFKSDLGKRESFRQSHEEALAYTSQIEPEHIEGCWSSPKENYEAVALSGKDDCNWIVMHLDMLHDPGLCMMIWYICEISIYRAARHVVLAFESNAIKYSCEKAQSYAKEQHMFHHHSMFSAQINSNIAHDSE